MKSKYHHNLSIKLCQHLFDAMVLQTVAMIIVNYIFIPYLQIQHIPLVILMVINWRDDDQEIDDEDTGLEYGESLSVPSDWED